LPLPLLWSHVLSVAVGHNRLSLLLENLKLVNVGLD
jgi:hypothetical protein